MNYYNLTKKLIQQVRVLRQENNSLIEAANESSEYYYSAQSRMEEKNKRLREENDRIERERQYERDQQSYRDYERQDLMKKLERSEQWGDSWGTDRLKRKLKEL